MSTHLMHIPAKGYFWRKRYYKKIIDVMLNTKDVAEATPRCAAVTDHRAREEG